VPRFSNQINEKRGDAYVKTETGPGRAGKRGRGLEYVLALFVQAISTSAIVLHVMPEVIIHEDEGTRVRGETADGASHSKNPGIGFWQLAGFGRKRPSDRVLYKVDVERLIADQHFSGLIMTVSMELELSSSEQKRASASDMQP
jgi:hypothetical protein